MPRGFGRLPFLTRRSTRSDGPASALPAMATAPADPDRAPVGPPALLPALIIRQVLVEATEVTPVWARPRPSPETLAVPPKSAPRKRTRRTPTGDVAKASQKPATPRRSRSSRPRKGDD